MSNGGDDGWDRQVGLTGFRYDPPLNRAPERDIRYDPPLNRAPERDIRYDPPLNRAPERDIGWYHPRQNRLFGGHRRVRAGHFSDFIHFSRKRITSG
jgi:hypothetical protein